ncbi:MAG: hypothetical protein JF592_09505 [Microbacterium sp.]|uniref:hypothetical protein n=1 Tax=Microbacterium sp. TaxID=51671 RepID=UPI001D574D20|nr:hypothetical protein [Microbacterium sp.]MBW8762806.1 hypothetical protein [Microbacterium sp.]
MDSDDDIPEATVRLTRRVRRRSQAGEGPIPADAGTEAVAGDGTDENAPMVEDRTVVMGRRRRAVDFESDDDLDEDSPLVEDRTVVMGRRRRAVDSESGDDVDEDSPLVEDHTVVMGRRRRGGADDSESDDDLDEHTHMIDDRTVAVERRRRPDLTADEVSVEDRTVAVERRRRTDAPLERAEDDEELYDTVSRPPAADVEKPPAIYKPRAAPRTPHRPPASPGDIAPTRVIDADRVSVAKAARRRSLYAVAAVSGACVVSVVGLVLLGFTVLL